MQDEKRRWSINDIITANGETHTVREWARANIENGLSAAVILRRLRSGWAPESAVTVRPDEEEKDKKMVNGLGADEEEIWVFKHYTSGSGAYVRQVVKKAENGQNLSKEGQ